MTLADPEVGGTSVVRMRKSVVLPAPFLPSSPKISPCRTLEGEAVKGADGLSAGAAVDLDQVLDVYGRAGECHREFSIYAVRRPEIKHNRRKSELARSMRTGK